MTRRKTAQELGKWGENLAKKYLEDKGFKIVFRNVYTSYGEIDLVAKYEGSIHFVEVKTRRTKEFGHPEESITDKKLTHMVESAEAFFQDHPELFGDWQIDVIAVQIYPGKDIPEIRFFENAI